MARNSWSSISNSNRGSASRKTNALLNLINGPDIDKVYLYAQDPYEAKYQLLINKRLYRLKVFKWSKSFYWIFKWYGWYLEKYWRIQSKKKQKVLLEFDHMIADMLSNKKLNPIVTELFISERKLNISLAFITQSYFRPKKYLVKLDMPFC